MADLVNIKSGKFNLTDIFSDNLLNRFSFKTFPQFMGAPLLLLLLPSVHCVRVNCSITDHLYHPPRISSTKVLSKSTILQILALLPVSSRASRVIDMKAKNIYFFPFVCQCNSSIDQFTLQENRQVMPLPWSFHHFVFIFYLHTNTIKHLST